MKGQTTNGLILVGVIVLVAGVAWFRTAREDTPAVANDVTAAPAAVDRSTKEAAAAPARKGELCPEPPPTAKPGDPSSMPVSDEERPEQPLATRPSGRGSSLRTPDEDRSEPSPLAKADAKPTSGSAAPISEPAVTKKLPRVVDIGAEKCKACKELAPILVELRKEYDGRVTVDFIDVWKNPKAGDPYKIRVIPTQVFFDKDGKEVWRHEGFLPKADFIAKFKELGVK